MRLHLLLFSAILLLFVGCGGTTTPPEEKGGDASIAVPDIETADERQPIDLGDRPEENVDVAVSPPDDTETPDATELPGPLPLPQPENPKCQSMAENNKHTGLSWGESYQQSALLLAFERTASPAKLVQFLERVQCVLQRRDDRLGRFTKAATWSYAPSAKGSSSSCSDPGLDGMILSPVGKYLQLLKEQPQLFHHDDLTHVDLLKEELERAVAETLEYHDKHSWNAELGTYRLHDHCKVTDSQGRSMSEFARLPFNLIATLAKVRFQYYLSTDNPHDLQKVIAVANDLNSFLSVIEEGALSWPYFYLDAQPEDISHGFIVAEFIKLLADHGTVFGGNELVALSNTVEHIILGQPGQVRHYLGDQPMPFYDSVQCHDASTAHAFTMCRSLALWLPYMEHKDTTESALELIPVNGKGDFDDLVKSHVAAYTRHLVYGDSCTHEGQCETGSCFGDPGLQQICGYKLGDTSACKKDSDCFSGQCYAGLVCGTPLGVSSGCTRHHECVSGFCDATQHCQTSP